MATSRKGSVISDTKAPKLKNREECSLCDSTVENNDIRERIPVRSSHNILLMEELAVYTLHESNFACYNCINGITSTAHEYSFASL